MLQIKESRNGKIDYLIVFAYVYLIIPFMIFVIGFCRPLISLPLVIIIIYSFFYIIRYSTTNVIINLRKWDWLRIVTVAIFSVLWVILSGIGGISGQTGRDQPWRNAIFEMLVNYQWPVHLNLVNAGQMQSRVLCYYIGFWLPSAVIGKIFGLQAGYYAQIIWASIGILLSYLLICRRINKVRILPFVIFVFFGGLDYIGTSLMSHAFIPISSIDEWWAGIAQYTSMGVQLANVFNQAIPAWVATAVLMTQKNNKCTLFMLGSIFICSVFPFAGLCILTIGVWLSYLFENEKKVTFADFRKEYITIPNIVGVCIGTVTFIYYISNSILQSTVKSTVATKLHANWLMLTESQQFNEELPKLQIYSNFSGGYETSYIRVFFLLCLFFILEAGVYFLFIRPQKGEKGLFYSTLLTLFLLPFINMITKVKLPCKDMIMRLSIPALLVLMIMLIEKLYQPRQQKQKIVIAICLIIAGLTELGTLQNEIKSISLVADNEKISENEIMVGRNFSGEVQGEFWEIMAKPLKEHQWKDVRINIPQTDSIPGVTVSGIDYLQEDGGWIGKRCILGIDTRCTDDIELSFIGRCYEDSQMNVRVNGIELGELKVSGDNLDSQLSTKCTIIIPKDIQSENGQFIEIYCNEPKTYYIDEEHSSIISMFVSSIEIKAK